MVLKSHLSVIAICLLAAAPCFAQDRPPLRYEISFPQAANHYVQIDLQVKGATENQELFLPVWTPGSYLVREYARHIDSFKVSGKDGAPLGFKKTSKNRWRIENAQDADLQVSYRIYCNEMSVRTNFVDREFALLNGAATFLTADDRTEGQHFVSVKLPDYWSRAVTSLKRERSAPHSFVAESHAELVDSPFVVGNPSLHAFEVGGVTHHLVNVSGDGLWNGDEAVIEVAKVVEEHQSMWQATPYTRYFFLNVIAESGGGLEHDNSTVMLTSRWSFRNKSSFKRWLGLVSHEFFHTWNIRRLRPKVLVNYDFENENYFEELWVAEGVTSYYDDLALVRSGITTQPEYLSALSRQITTVETTPGKNVQSLALSSHDAWIKYYRPDENSRNTSVSYYTKGSLAAFLLDLEIRRATNDVKSLDDVMRRLWKDHLSEGYTNADVMRIASELADIDTDSWSKNFLYGTTPLDYGNALEWLGLEFAHESQKKKEADLTWLGMSSSTDDGKLIVKSVVENGPAFQAGINVDDELIGMNGYRLGSSLGERVRQLAKNDQVEFLIARRGKMHNIAVSLAEEPQSSWRIRLVKEPTEQQQASLRKWLHLPEPKTPNKNAESNSDDSSDTKNEKN